MLLLANRLDSAGSILVVAAAALGVALWQTSAVVSGDYPRDVEIIELVTAATTTTTTTAATIITKKNHRDGYNNVFRYPVSYYPSYVKGEDPVEEYNRRRLHVDTSDYVKGAEQMFPDDEKNKLLEESLLSIRKKYAKRSDGNERKKKDRMVMKGKSSKKSKKRRKARNPIKRSWNDKSIEIANGTDSHALAAKDYPKRYEESDPDVFPYERSTDNRRGSSLPVDTKYFQYFNFFGDGSYNTGLKRGTDRHYIEQHERASNGAGIFQKRVKWADKDGGFGEHYWDFNHV